MTQQSLVPKEPLEDDHWRLKLLGMRLRLSEGQTWPFQHITTALTEEQVLIFLVKNDKGVILEDERGLFPSDALITQLRVLMD